MPSQFPPVGSKMLFRKGAHMISTFLQWGPLRLNLTSWIVLGGMNLEWVLMHWHWEPLSSLFSRALPVEQNSVVSRYMNSVFICSPEANCIPSCNLILVPQTLCFLDADTKLTAGCWDKINSICTTQQLHFQSCWCADAFELKFRLLSFCHDHLLIFFLANRVILALSSICLQKIKLHKGCNCNL